MEEEWIARAYDVLDMGRFKNRVFKMVVVVSHPAVPSQLQCGQQLTLKGRPAHASKTRTIENSLNINCISLKNYHKIFEFDDVVAKIPLLDE